MTRHQDLVIVIRAAGERTFDACKALVLSQAPEVRVLILNERPFEAALRRCYQIGMESGATWMMTLDADVLLKDGAIEQLMSKAEAMPEQYFQIEGRAHDKLTGRSRKVGHRIYRTKYLSTALEHLPAIGTEIRPERATLGRMEKLGYLSLREELVVGVHDYEQFYRDIYRKAFIHANKHQAWLPMFIDRWKALAAQDADFLVALRGLYDGLMSLSRPRIDIADYANEAAHALHQLGLEEKPRMDATNAGRIVDTVLETARSLEVEAAPPPRERFASRLKTTALKRAWVRVAFYKAGLLLIGAGAKIVQLANFGKRS